MITDRKVKYSLVFVFVWVFTYYMMSAPTSAVDTEMFQFKQEVVDGSNKFRLLRPDGSSASYSDALQLLESSDSSFRQQLIDVLHQQQRVTPAFFWECPPFSLNTLNVVPFEFVILPAPVLLTRQPDKESFGEKFQHGSAAVAFPSLGGDAMLIAPVPQEGVDDRAYMHLASFIHNANQQQVDAMWLTVAHTIRKQLNSSHRKIWLSTSGAGVQWLHVRLDSRPKYYNWQEYINM